MKAVSPRLTGRIVTMLGALCVLLVSTWGCTTDECLQNKNALPLAGFYDTAESDRKVSVDSIEVRGVGVPGDSILFPGTAAASQLYLPFRLDADTTRYVFRYMQKRLAALDIRDTVTFIYSRQPRFVSSACGVSYVFGIKGIKSTGIIIDSVTCPMHEINSMDTENLHIYLRVAPEETPEDSQ